MPQSLEHETHFRYLLVLADTAGMGEPNRPWIKLQLPPGAGRDFWAELLRDLDSWLRQRGDGVTIYDVKPVRDDPPAPPTIERRDGLERRTS